MAAKMKQSGYTIIKLHRSAGHGKSTTQRHSQNFLGLPTPEFLVNLFPQHFFFKKNYN